MIKTPFQDCTQLETLQHGLTDDLSHTTGLNHGDHDDDNLSKPCICDDNAQSHDEFDGGKNQADADADADADAVNHDDGLYHATELNQYDHGVLTHHDSVHTLDYDAQNHCYADNCDDDHEFVHYHGDRHDHVPSDYAGYVHYCDDHRDVVQNHGDHHGHVRIHDANYVHDHADHHDHVQNRDDRHNYVRNCGDHVQYHSDDHVHGLHHGDDHDYYVQHHVENDDHMQHHDDYQNYMQHYHDKHGSDDAVALLLDPVENEDEFVEVDPDNRYGHYHDLLGTGAVKRVYRGFDKQEGIEVAWNQVSLHNVSHVKNEIHLLDTLKHKNIIKIYKFWVDREASKINFITELCSNTLLGFRRQHRHVCMKAVKDWARQILRALVYLHSQNPPIIHRDLKCENIFVNCSSGKIKIGDFGSATLLDGSGHLQDLVGTPEFMAPEMYMEDYNELVDVYAFGMCMIELLTVEIPYNECEGIAHIYQKVSTGVKPKALDKIKDLEAMMFIRKCLAPVSQRPSAAELLLDPFLLCEGQAQSGIRIHSHVPGGPILTKSASSPNLNHSCMVPLVSKPNPQEQKKLTSHISFLKERSWREVTVFGKVQSESKLVMRLRIVQPDAPVPMHVNFPYDCNCDTPESVAEEMVQELDFPKSDSALIADLIASALASLMQAKPGNEDAEQKGAIGGTNSALSSQGLSCLKATA